MIRILFLISILSITMSNCEGQPKTTGDNESSVVFISDTVNNKIDVKINGAHFTSYIYDKSLPKLCSDRPPRIAMIGGED